MEGAQNRTWYAMGIQTTLQPLPQDPLRTVRLGEYFSDTVTGQMASKLCGPQVLSRILIGDDHDNELGVTHLGGGPEAHRDGQQEKEARC